MAEPGRVVAASRRPDGTLRKERRVRDGYVPQDEQPVYMSRGALAKQGVPHCPGFDPEDEAKAKAAVLSKNQKKNERRKNKAAAGGEEQQPEQPGPAAQPGGSVATLTAGLAATHLSTQPEGEVQAAAPCSLEKELRALRKKIRQAEGLAEKVKQGQQLTKEEAEKAAKLAGWNAEVAQLEQRLQAGH